MRSRKLIKNCKKELSCFITGHRPERFHFKNNENDIRCIKLKESLRKALLMTIHTGKNTFYTGMAQGCDLWAGEILLELKELYPHIKLVAVIPFQGQEKEWDSPLQKRYHFLLEKCDLNITLSPIPDKKYFRIRNQLMVILSSKAIVVYDEKLKRSGTGMTFHLAEKQGLEIIRIDTHTFEIMNSSLEEVD